MTLKDQCVKGCSLGHLDASVLKGAKIKTFRPQCAESC